MPAAPSMFANHLPVRVQFGRGVVNQLPDVLERLGCDRWVAVLDPAVVDLPELSAPLRGAAQTFVVSDGEPTIEDVDQLGAEVREAGADGVVAIGGGSTLDRAKGARLIAELGGTIRRFIWPGEPDQIPALQLPLVTVPTTAGTGSEVTGGIVMSDHRRGIKVGAPSPQNRAQISLVDPELTFGLPPAPTLYGGLDVVAQAIGAVVTAAHTPVSDAIGLEALRYAARALPAVTRDSNDHEARTEIACASLLAGLAMNLAEAGTDHSLGHALGVRFGVPHGLSVAVVLAATIEHDRRFVPERFERVADALGVDEDGSGDGSRAVRGVRQLLDEVGCPTLASLGVSDDDVPTLAELTLAGWIPVEPGPWGRGDVEAAFRRALTEHRTPARA